MLERAGYIRQSAIFDQAGYVAQCLSSPVAIDGFKSFDSLPDEVLEGIAGRWCGEDAPPVTVAGNAVDVKAIREREGNPRGQGLALLKATAEAAKAGFMKAGMPEHAQQAAAETAAYVALNPSYDSAGQKAVHDACGTLADAANPGCVEIVVPDRQGHCDPYVTIRRTATWSGTAPADSLKTVNDLRIYLDRPDARKRNYMVRAEAHSVRIETQSESIRRALFPPAVQDPSIFQRIMNFLADLFRRDGIYFVQSMVDESQNVSNAATPLANPGVIEVQEAGRVRNSGRAIGLRPLYLNGERRLDAPQEALTIEQFAKGAAMLEKGGLTAQLRGFQMLTDAIKGFEPAQQINAIEIMWNAIDRLHPAVRQGALASFVERIWELGVYKVHGVFRSLLRRLAGLHEPGQYDQLVAGIAKLSLDQELLSKVVYRVAAQM